MLTANKGAQEKTELRWISVANGYRLTPSEVALSTRYTSATYDADNHLFIMLASPVAFLYL